jgi:hypothetical protein
VVALAVAAGLLPPKPAAEEVTQQQQQQQPACQQQRCGLSSGGSFTCLQDLQQSLDMGGS